MPLTRRGTLRGIGALSLAATVPASTALADDGGSAGLRVAHASPDAPAVDVYVDGAEAVSGLEFRSVTDYLELEAGEYEVAVNAAGTDTTVFGPVELELAAEDYTAVARGEVTSDDSTFTVDVLEDTNGANVGDDEARIRAIHASPDAPAVDVTVNDGALTLFDGVSYGESSGYAVVPAGSYEVEIRPDSGGDPVYEASVTLDGGSTYTAFAEGYLTPGDEPADETFGLVFTEDADAPPRGGPGGPGGDDDGEEGGEAEEGEEEEAEGEEE